ncbi:MAG: YdeI/OmpD-associated family protein [Imperialibacter sp.]
MSPTFFPTPSDFRKWLEKNHQQETELLVGFYKKASGKPSITWPESVDQALCFGWIDGIRRSIDEESYSVRFTPRKPKSIWSAVNIKKVAELTKLGLMLPAGLEIFSKREEKWSEGYSFEQNNIALGKEYEAIFEANQMAWQNFNNMAPSYKKPAIWWVISAKQEVTRRKRLATLIEDSAANIKVKHLRR